MKRIISWLKQKKKFGYVLLTVLILVLSVSVVSSYAKVDNEHAVVIDAETLRNYPDTGFVFVEHENGVIEFMPTEGSNGFFIATPQGKMWKLSLIMHPNTEYNAETFKLSYRLPDKDFHKDNVAPALAPYHNGEVFFLINNVAEVRLEAGNNFSLSEIRMEEVTGAHAFEVVPFATLCVLLLLLAIFNAKIGYFTFVKETAGNIFAGVKEEIAQKKYAVSILHIAMLVFTGAYAITLWAMLLFGSYTGMSVFVVVGMTAAAVLFQLLYRLISGNGMRPATLFLVIGLLIGLMFAYSLPSLMILSYDDETHYVRSEVLSRIFFGHDRTYADFSQTVRIFHLKHFFEDQRGTELRLLLMDQCKIPEKGYSVNFYAYIAYFHQAFIIGLSDWMSIDFLLQMTLLKMSNVFLYVSVIYLGMRRLKSGGYLLSSICLLPTCLFLASTINYDFWINAFLIYAFSIFISELQQPDKPMAVGNMVRMLGAMLLGCGPKAVYFVMTFPFLFIRKSKFADKKQRKIFLIAALAIMALILMSFILPFFVNMNTVTDHRGGEDVSAPDQMKFIFSDPLAYTKILLTFISEYVSLNFAFTMSTSYAYLGTVAPVLSTLALAMIAFCVFTDKSEHDAFPGVGGFKTITLFTCFAQIAVFATALYIGFTPVGYETILGVQWRYIVPVLFPALYCIGSSYVTNRMGQRRMSAIVFSGLSLILLVSYLQVFVVRL